MYNYVSTTPGIYNWDNNCNLLCLAICSTLYNFYNLLMDVQSIKVNMLLWRQLEQMFKKIIVAVVVCFSAALTVKKNTLCEPKSSLLLSNNSAAGFSGCWRFFCLTIIVISRVLSWNFFVIFICLFYFCEFSITVVLESQKHEMDLKHLCLVFYISFIRLGLTSFLWLLMLLLLRHLRELLHRQLF